MAVSKAIVPLLNGKEVESLMRTAKSSKMRGYTEEERMATDKKVEQVLAERRRKRCTTKKNV